MSASQIPIAAPTTVPDVAPPRLLEVEHVAHRLRFCAEHVRRLIRQKKLTAIRLGTQWRIDPIDLQTYIDAQRVSVSPPVTKTTTDKFSCPHCGAWKSRVIDSRPDAESALRYLRWRHCATCDQLFETAEELTGRLRALSPDGVSSSFRSDGAVGSSSSDG